MKKRLLALLLALGLILGLAGCGEILLEETPDISEDAYGESELPVYDDPTEADTAEPTAQPEADTTEAPTEEEPALEQDGRYYSKEDVALYLYLYGCLPDNFLTKDEARDLGWEGGSVEVYAPGYAIGGDRFGNREGLLPEAEGRVYYECDIDTNGASSRGAKRIVFSNDGLIYYTEDHYESFEQLYGEE
ncbi:MAG: ribonuclease [Oscillospiraceae bacterium]|nr:ribonuclease [Oscillospiraceae bacterium]